jgi:hypothetical protein
MLILTATIIAVVSRQGRPAVIVFNPQDAVLDIESAPGLRNAHFQYSFNVNQITDFLGYTNGCQHEVAVVVDVARNPGDPAALPKLDSDEAHH